MRLKTLFVVIICGLIVGCFDQPHNIFTITQKTEYDLDIVTVTEN